MKKFWKRTEGFTLVELVVVIAILGILAGVGTVGYSGYVKKANMAADQQLIGQVKSALELYYYSNPNVVGSSSVVLNREGTDANADGFGDDAMKAAFGDNWKQSAFLKYDDWNGSYDDSSWKGKETVVMGHVEDMTEVLGNTIAGTPTLVGPRFDKFMTDELGFSDADKANSGKAADAAVLYVANGTKNLNPQQREQFKTIASTAAAADDVFPAMMNGYSSLYGGNYVMGAAATYAMLTGYCQYVDAKNDNTAMMDALGTPSSAGITTGSLQEMTGMIMESVGRIESLSTEEEFYKYFNEVSITDAAAFIDVMGAVDAAKGQIVGNLGSEGCFVSQSVKDMFANFVDGCVIINAKPENGGVNITTSLDN